MPVIYRTVSFIKYILYELKKTLKSHEYIKVKSANKLIRFTFSYVKYYLFCLPIFIVYSIKILNI